MLLLQVLCTIIPTVCYLRLQRNSPPHPSPSLVPVFGLFLWNLLLMLILLVHYNISDSWWKEVPTVSFLLWSGLVCYQLTFQLLQYSSFHTCRLRIRPCTQDWTRNISPFTDNMPNWHTGTHEYNSTCHCIVVYIGGSGGDSLKHIFI